MKCLFSFFLCPLPFVAVSTLNTGPLSLEGPACLEFWYLSPVLPNVLTLTVYLKSSDGFERVWSQTAQSMSGRKTWTQVFVPLNLVKPGTKVK